MSFRDIGAILKKAEEANNGNWVNLSMSTLTPRET